MSTFSLKKTCKKCLQEKSVQDFHKKDRRYPDSLSGYQSTCKLCRDEYKPVPAKERTLQSDEDRKKSQAAWYQANKDRALANTKAYYAANKMHLRKMDRAYQASVKFGIPREDFLKLEAETGRNCEICHKNVDENGKKLAMDHDHATGKFRGFLCHMCNIGLGAFMDSPALVNLAFGYLTTRGGGW